MSEISACAPCLRRSWLLAALGPYIERVAIGGCRGGSPGLLRLADDELAEAVAPGEGRRILAEVEGLADGWFEERLADARCWAICRHDERWPGGLGDPGGPRALIGRGEAGALAGLTTEASVTIVGTRRASGCGRQVAYALGNGLAAAGVVVVSGLAFGIDGCAHSGALEAGRPTLAVLGCGPETPYPAAHRSLWEQMTQQGAVISELPPGSTPWRWTFPARSRVMAALSGTTVVVEATEGSGALVTAGLAAAAGRMVGAVPGPVTRPTSVGPNALLAAGARVVRDAADVLDAAGRTASAAHRIEAAASAADEREERDGSPCLRLRARARARCRGIHE